MPVEVSRILEGSGVRSFEARLRHGFIDIMSEGSHCFQCKTSRHPGGTLLPRHRHASGYIAVVLTGGYMEAGDTGRYRALAGSVILHADHEAHLDAFETANTTVLNLPAPGPIEAGAGLIDDPDEVARAAELDPIAAARLTMQRLQPGGERPRDWPDLLVDDLARNPNFSITRWAERAGLSPASISRGFMQVFGVSPKRFRLETRTRLALQAIRQTRDSLADIAVAHGFADQAHMTRAVSQVTGGTPAAIRAKFVQAE